MIALSCQCGGVSIEIERSPDYVHQCNCTLCTKSGARWGYFHPDDVRVEGPTRSFRRRDRDKPSAELHFCGVCGSTTHYVLTEDAVARFGNVVMGANMLLADECELAGIELRYPDGRGWSGEGPFRYVRPARVLGQVSLDG